MGQINSKSLGREAQAVKAHRQQVARIDGSVRKGTGRGREDREGVRSRPDTARPHEAEEVGDRCPQPRRERHALEEGRERLCRGGRASHYRTGKPAPEERQGVPVWASQAGTSSRRDHYDEIHVHGYRAPRVGRGNAHLH